MLILSIVWFLCYCASILIGYEVIKTQFVNPLAKEFYGTFDKEFITVAMCFLMIVLWPTLLFHAINVKLHLVKDELEEAE
jgi:hypothetical protein